MSIFESMKEEAADLYIEIKGILKLNNDELYGKDRLYDISFEHYGKEQFEAVFELIEKLSKCNLNKIPLETISNIRRKLREYKNIFKKAKTLNFKDGGDIKQQRDLIVREIENYYAGFFELISKVISLTSQIGINFQADEAEVKHTVNSIKLYSEEQKTKIESKMQEADSILKSMRIASAEAGVSQNAIHYSSAQKNYAIKAKKWYIMGSILLITLIGAVATAGAIYFYYKRNDIPVLSYLEISILIIISLWIYAINFCNKNFYAEKHNETINANKAKTLTTFRSFVDATKNENVKDQVLIYASASAFSNPSTGFNKAQGVPLPPGVELTKQLIKSSTKHS